MWPLVQFDHHIISYSFSPHKLTCSWIEKSKQLNAHFILQANKHYALNNENIVLFNPTYTKECITKFLIAYNKRDAFIAFTLTGPPVQEYFVTLPTSTPKITDFGIQKSPSIIFQYHYLYQNDHGQYVFYAYTVPRYLILQYQLIAIQARINLLIITTEYMALFGAYKTIFGPAFRRSQFGIDMMRHNNMLKNVFLYDTIRRIVTVSSSCTINNADIINIVPACGIIALEGSSL